jgi:hypothetical protein
MFIVIFPPYKIGISDVIKCLVAEPLEICNNFLLVLNSRLLRDFLGKNFRKFKAQSEIIKSHGHVTMEILFLVLLEQDFAEIEVSVAFVAIRSLLFQLVTQFAGIFEVTLVVLETLLELLEFAVALSYEPAGDHALGDGGSRGFQFSFVMLEGFGHVAQLFVKDADVVVDYGPVCVGLGVFQGVFKLQNLFHFDKFFVFCA